jgi:MFS family permease
VEREPAGDRRTLVFVCATAFAVVLNGTMLPVALPEIGAEFSLAPAGQSWVLTAFFLVNGVAIPFCGRLTDRVGTPPPIPAGVVAAILVLALLSAGAGSAANFSDAFLVLAVPWRHSCWSPGDSPRSPRDPAARCAASRTRPPSRA